jgi:hypothetical protein
MIKIISFILFNLFHRIIYLRNSLTSLVYLSSHFTYINWTWYKARLSYDYFNVRDLIFFLKTKGPKYFLEVSR